MMTVTTTTFDKQEHVVLFITTYEKIKVNKMEENEQCVLTVHDLHIYLSILTSQSTTL